MKKKRELRQKEKEKGMVTCNCGNVAIWRTVKKDNQNKGRDFWTCSECNFFKWAYDPLYFKQGACYRCGRFGCEAPDCKEKHDYYGNVIPNYWDEFYSK